MSDYHEMFESWSDVVPAYDPDYPMDGGRHKDDNLQPIDPDDWADDDLEGGF